MAAEGEFSARIGHTQMRRTRSAALLLGVAFFSLAACVSTSQLNKAEQNEILERKAGGIILTADISGVSCPIFKVTFRNVETEAQTTGVLRNAFGNNQRTGGMVKVDPGTYKAVGGKCVSTAQSGDFITTTIISLSGMADSLPLVEVKAGAVTYPGSLKINPVPKGTEIAKGASVEERLDLLTSVFVAVLEVRNDRAFSSEEKTLLAAYVDARFRADFEDTPSENEKSESRNYVSYRFEDRAADIGELMGGRYERLADRLHADVSAEMIDFPFGKTFTSTQRTRAPQTPKAVAERQQAGRPTGQPRQSPPSSFKAPPRPTRN